MSIYYQINEFIIKLNTPEEICFESLKTHLPGIKKIKNVKKYDLEVVFKEKKSFCIKKKKKYYCLKGQWDTIIKNDFPHLLYNMFKEFLIYKNIYAVHSVNINKHLLVGHSGTGKTTLVLEALKNSIPVYSADKTLLYFKENQLYQFSGTNIISIRKCSSSSNGTEVSLKNLKVKPTHKINIKKLYFFSISNEPLVVQPIDYPSNLHQIYPYFLDVIKENTILKNEFVFTTFISKKSKEKLVKNLNEYLNNNLIYFISGSVKEIVKFIGSSP